MLLFNCRKRRSNLQIFLLHLTNHRSTHRLLCLTYVFNASATIVCWDTKIFAKRFVLRTFYSKFSFFCDGKVCLTIIFQFVHFRARARNGVSGLLLLCWKTSGKPYHWKKTRQQLGWLWANVLPERRLCQS